MKTTKALSGEVTKLLLEAVRDSSLGQQQRGILEDIIAEYGRFLETRHPIVEDCDLLPYPKDVIYAVLEWKERELVNVANRYVREHHSRAPGDLEEYLDTVRKCRTFLLYYSEIDPEDRERVGYFNTFAREADVPPEESLECLELQSKYMNKGFADMQGHR